jgi:uncharacterized membrane protein YhaH (DUF805 family)
MKNASDTIENRSRALRVVAQCLNQMRHHIRRLHDVQYENLQEIYALLSRIRWLQDFKASNPILFTSFTYLVQDILVILQFPSELAAASA